MVVFCFHILRVDGWMDGVFCHTFQMKDTFKKSLISEYLLVFINDILEYGNNRNVLVILIMDYDSQFNFA
jgi:hypothetical protein